MILVFIVCTSMELFCEINGQTYSSPDNCRQLEFISDQIDNKRLVNHIIRTIDAASERSCRHMCYMEPNCVSFNLEKTARDNGKHRCELNNFTSEEQQDKLETNLNYTYRGAENACENHACLNKATCQSGFTDKGYRCLCVAGFMGQHCEKGMNDPDLNVAIQYVRGDMLQGHGGEIFIESSFYFSVVKSCQEYYDIYKSSESQLITLILDSQPISVLCQVGKFGCGDGAWTPVMKMDGNKETFVYFAQLWSNKESYNLDGGKTGFDTQETKLPTYWNTSFSKICLGMKINQQEEFIVINKSANSLHSLIADGQYRNTSLGLKTWKSLLGSQGSLQVYCNKEGFNAASDELSFFRARIGVLGNNENDCSSCDSAIGFGTDDSFNRINSCGNVATHGGDNGDRHIKAIGYILVQ